MKPSESQTRYALIDPKLKESGWKVLKPTDKIPENGAFAVGEFDTKEGPADYALFIDGLIVAVVEAKKLSVGPQNVLVQAQRYARGVKNSPFDFNGLKVPFIYSTNGEIIWFQDLRNAESYSEKVAKFHTPSAINELLLKNPKIALELLEKHPNDHPRLRYYQIDATKAIEDSLRKNKRNMMVAMATGTGKTYTVISEIYRLMKSNYGKRILFLVDRRALAAQAVRAFKTFEPEPGKKFDKLYEVYSQRMHKDDFDDDFKFNPQELPSHYLEHPQPGLAFVYVSTIQRMRINIFGKESRFEDEPSEETEFDAEKLNIPINAFDIVIADECHRGYTATEESKWREVLNHFNAVKIGLTATPAAHTTAYFGTPVFRYDYEQAVNDGYLVPFDEVKIASNVRMKGIFLKENEKVGMIDTETGREVLDQLEDERQFDPVKIEKEITSPDSNRKILKEVAKYIKNQEKEFGRFPKTLIFAVGDLPHASHCDQIVRVCRELFGKGDDFVQKITGNPNVDRPLQRIREFRNRQKPGVVVTVDMLSTGIDIPALENIVFMRPVKSRILFTQMMGRGTRTCDEIGKTHFTAFDCFDGTLLEYFNKITDFTSQAPDKPGRTMQEIIKAIHNNQDRKYNTTCLIKRMHRISKSMSAEAFPLFEKFIEKGDIGVFASKLPERLETDFVGTIKILENKEFQDVLHNYPKAQKVFLVAHETKDEVSSEYVFRTNDGRELKPVDYLKEFEQFVKKNPEKIEAIKILLERPKGWGTEPLTDLRKKLEQTPQRFTEDNLRRAYHNELADIISIIKHAAKNEPLLTAEERVAKAIEKVTKGKQFTPEQVQWLELIKNHMVTNLAVEKEDFEEMPIFARRGSWKKADKIFNGKLEPLLKQFNEAMAR
ncbi:MAG: type I restriction-modification enzyme R subunit C-terminal domain-containing protein [Candidatus Diapherotrites archaeon]